MAKCKVGLPSVVQLRIQEEEEIDLVAPLSLLPEG